MGAVYHFGRRGGAAGQHGAQGLVAAQHRCEVLQFLCELFDLLTQSRILFLQVFTLLERDNRQDGEYRGRVGRWEGGWGRKAVPGVGGWGLGGSESFSISTDMKKCN